MGIIETIKKITREEAIQEERKRKNLEIAKNLKKTGVDIKIIAEATGLSIEEIQKL